MNTTAQTYHHDARRNTSDPSSAGILHRVSRGLLTLLVVIVGFITAIPVVLLFFVTGVPIWISILLALLDAGIIAALIMAERSGLNLLVGAGAFLTVAALAIVLSQQFASTPPITDDNGAVIPGSIASLERVELNGSTQWMTIRGHSDDLPVLLFLSGGPGGSELAMTRKYLAELEQHFIIVNWDQPGVGKSYNAVDFANLTPERFAEDAHALTLHLRERFGKEKIYVFGESWGSILGVWMVQQHPDLYHALVTTGQMIAPVENDIQLYEFAIQQLTDQGRMDDVASLRANGAPPYERDELVGHFMAMNSVGNAYMESHAHGEGVAHNLLFDSLGAQEYGLLDKVYWVLSLTNTFPHVYSQLNDVDLRTQAAELDVPVYMIKGRWDVNASNALAEDYFNLLEAPHKEWIWFEDSAHTPSWDEPAHFVDVMIDTVLSQTQTPGQ